MGSYQSRKNKNRKKQQLNDAATGSQHRELDSIKNLFINGHTTKGYSELLKYIEKYPNDPYGHHYMGKISLRRNDLETAKREFAIVASSTGKNRHNGIADLARVYWLEGNKDKARECYQAAINDNPFNHLLPYLALSQLEREENNYYGALNILYAALEIDDSIGGESHSCNKNDIRLSIVKNLISIGKEDEADALLQSIVPENRKQARDIAFRKGTICRDQREFEKALVYFAEARRTDEKDKMYYQSTLELARVSRQLGKIDDQIAYLEELDNAERYFDGDVPVALGTALLIKKDYQGAKKSFKKGLHSNDASLRNSAAYHYASLQLLEDDIFGAEITLKNVLAENKVPDYPNYIALIRILYEQGKYSEAEMYLEDVRSKDPDCSDYYPFRRMELLIKKKQGKTLPSRTGKLYLERQIIDYSPAEAIDQVVANHTSGVSENSNFPDGTNIRELFADLQPFLIDDNKLMVSVLDEYEIPYPNAGYYGNHIFDTIRVKTLPGTTQVVTFHPCDASLLPTRGAIKQEKAREKSKGNDRISKFNARFAKFNNNEQ